MTPYLPRLVVDWMSADAGARHREVHGTLAFVDISGFTKLSERLAKRGKVGAEDLSDAIDRSFNQLLGVAGSEGGMLIKFGGDALLLLFAGPYHAHRACRAAGEMRRALRQVGRVDVAGARAKLRMSVGVHTGTFNMFLVGGIHRELVLTGPDATATVRMEGAASAGEIVVSEATAAQLPPSATAGADSSGGAAGSAGGRLLRRQPRSATVIDVRSIPPTRPGDAELVCCVPVALRAHLLSPHHGPEHRRATVAFVHFDGTDELIARADDPDAATALIDELVTTVQNAAVHHDVTFLGSDIDADGGKFILVAGVPVAGGGGEERMLRCLREIVEAGTRIPVRAGVNRGDVFAGEIGTPERRTYTVMGDTVNLAARLMARAAPGQLLASPTVTDRSRAAFELTELEPFAVKGKALPVRAVAVGPAAAPGGPFVPGAQEGLPRSTPLVGRQVEVERLTDALERARRGSGSLVEIVGDVGLGKTRLLEEVRVRARTPAQREQGAPGAGTFKEAHRACELYESTTPYSALRDWARTLLGCVADRPHQEQVESLRTCLAGADPALVAWAPLFASLVDLDVPDTPETAAIETQFRAERLGVVFADLVRRVVSESTLLTIEDTHWMDDASANLLGHVAGAAADVPLLICTTRRSDESGFRADPSQSVSILPFTDIEAIHLIEVETEASPLPPHVTAALVERAGGNPLYLTELLAAARGPGGRFVHDVAELPDSVDALITARIDRLEAEDRNLLRHASVLGRSFPVRWLEQLVSRPLPDILGRLAGFVRLESEGLAGFEHALIRDAAYEGLPYRTRYRLHAQVAAIIGAGDANVAEERAGLLSLHYLRAQRYEEAWRHALVAAGRARAVYANLEAAELYERAIDAARRVPALTPSEVAAAYEALGDAREAFGGYSDAEAAFRTARRVAGGDPIAQARLLHKTAVVQAWLDRYSAALRTLSRGLRLVAGDDSPDALRQRARLLAAYASFCEMEGDHRRTVKWCRAAIEAAEAAGEPEANANASRMLDWALAQMGALDKPDNLQRALGIYRDLGDLPGQANALNMLGALSYWRGEWSAALLLYDEAQQAATRSSNTVLAALFGANMAEILLDQGRVELASSLLSGASRVTQAAGTRSGNAFALCNLARLASREGRHAEALALFDRVISEAEDVGRQHEAVEGRARKAECLLAAGQVEAARELAEATLESTRSSGGAPQDPLLHRVRAVAYARSGDRLRSEEAFEASLAAARERSAEYEAALTQDALANMLRRFGETPPAELEMDSQEVLGRLGVVEVASLYG